MYGLPLGHADLGDLPPVSRKLTRRQLFVRGALAAGGLIVSSAVIRYGWFLKAGPAAGFHVFSAREVQILEAVLLTFFPGAEGMPPADLEHLVPKIDGFLAQNDPDTRTMLRALLHVIDDQSRFFHLRRFVDLTVEERAAEVRAWETTPVYLKKAAFRSLKLIVGMHYSEQPDVRQAMGWYLGCSPAHLTPPTLGGAGV